jgi:hypothetical protein
MSKRSNPGCFFLVTVPITLLVLLSISAMLVLWILRGEYRSWRDDFESNYLSKEFVKKDDLELKEGVDEKLTMFASSTEDVDFVELSTDEALFVLLNELEGSIPYGIKVERGIVRAMQGQWDIFIQSKFKDTRLPWVRIRVEKDDIESAELFVSDMYMGPYDLGEWGFKGVQDDINRGFAEALILVNENEFSGRRFENIELEENSMIVKGRL